MTLRLERIGDTIQFQAHTESGYTFSIGSEPEHEGVRPMQMVALSFGGCSSIDILTILQKQRQAVTHFDVAVDGERADAVPAVFTRLHAHYRLEGDVDPDKVRRAIELSLDKYCSVSKMLEPTVALAYTFTINGETYEGRTRQPEQAG